ncbi:ABC transporter ATP-binding protein [Iamia sp. SCSIO 61187]|uniref:ABC transporter ATP-binding protein n=1 Tax=Iamia sp. SCSIO 61187 TaxID=2722752 RepID=UPI001C631B36|nr:ABC transporter ATP-binding protein [Iamia sp. SCSIO 61187]QYG93961.1 ABC transporter ATP-binding protein [Iamia sp. SCSIO 61187]
MRRARGSDAVAPAGRSREGWRLLLRQMRVQWAGILAGVAVGLVWTVGRVSIPSLVQRAIDQGMEQGDQGRITYWAVVIALVATVTAACTGLRRYMAFREARRAEAHLRDRLFAHLIRLSFPFHDRTATGQLMSRANTDLQQLQNFFSIIPLALANVVTVLATAVILVTINPLLTLLSLGALPFLVVLTRKMSADLFPTQMAVQQESAELAEVVEETVAGVRVVKGFGAEGVQDTRLRREADDVFDASMAGAAVRARYWPTLELLPTVGLILVLGYGGHLVIDGRLSVGELVAFNAYVTLLVWPMRMLGWIVAMAQRAVASAERVAELLDTDVDVDEPSRPVPLPARVAAGDGPGVGRVAFEDVSFGYAFGDVAGPRVLDGFSLEIPAGQSVAVVGGTGSGKSTVARLLCRFYDVDAGAVRLDGVDVRDVGLHDLRRAVGLVFEDTFLFSDSIGANIAFADPDASLAAVERAARLAGAHEFVSDLPQGYDTLIGERGYSLSGGQRQRIAIARAILADPRVLILDDATSAVDPTKEHEIRDALAEVMRGRTTIVIAHRPATIALAERVVLVDGGRVVADGTHRSLLASSARYRQVLASASAADEAAAAEAAAAQAGRAGADEGASLPVGGGS